ncbi:MAG: GNAT family N-acetyltransferase [Streptosporangiaceae bacterium]
MGPRWKTCSAGPEPPTGAGACTGASARAITKGRGRKNKHDLRQLAASSPSPGLFAFDDGIAVGWCELAPRADLGWLAHTRHLQPVDDLPVWSVPCFYVRRTHRRRGVMDALIEAASTSAASAGAPALEAYPVDTAVPAHTGNLFPGTVAASAPPRLPGRGQAQARPPGHAPDPRVRIGARWRCRSALRRIAAAARSGP